MVDGGQLKTRKVCDTAMQIMVAIRVALVAVTDSLHLLFGLK